MVDDVQGRRYALKFVNMDTDQGSDLLKESIFLKKSIDCPYIINCFDTFLSDDCQSLVICLELCKYPLKQIFSTIRTDLIKATNLFLECLKGLSYIHKK